MTLVCMTCGMPRYIAHDRCPDCGGRNFERAPAEANWDVAVLDGKPELVMNAAAIRFLMKHSPLGEERARRVLIARGVPAELLED